jgi:Uma2 family endonuclease
MRVEVRDRNLDADGWPITDAREGLETMQSGGSSLLTAYRAKFSSMVAAPHFPIHTRSMNEEQRVLLHDVPWSTYVVLRDSVESPGVRMTYLEGLLEIMSPSRAHEVEKKQIARLLELFCLERDIPLFGYGSTTFRSEEKERGLEPDECYCRGQDKDIPDIALEVVKTHGAIDKLDVYRKLGVREIWVFEDGKFSLFALRGDRYAAIEQSEVLPEVDLQRLAAHSLEQDQHAALKVYRDELRASNSRV